MAAPRGLSQPPTSFIGSQCQGIHHAPLNTYKHKTNIRNCTSANNNHTPPHPPQRRAGSTGPLLARCSQPLSTNQTPHTPPPKRSDNHPPPTRCTGLLSQSPIVCLMNNLSPSRPKDQPPKPGKRLLCTRADPTTGHVPSNESLSSPNPHGCGRGMSLVVLLRKEVIQPHLPVRLPCYDFVPIADPTFDGSLPYGLGHRLRVLPTFMT